MRFPSIYILTLAVLFLTACGGSTVAPSTHPCPLPPRHHQPRQTPPPPTPPDPATTNPARPRHHQPRQTPPPPTPTPTAPSAPTATPPSTAAPATCDSGGASQEPAPGSPYFHQVYRAASADGLEFAPDNQLVLDHASVPDAVMMPNGSTLLYFVNGLPGQHGIWVATQSPGGEWDVINFSVESRLLVVKGVTDPSLVRLPSGAWLMALSQGPQTHLAHSQDGNIFQLRGDAIELGGVPEMALLPGGRVRPYVSAMGIKSLISDDNGVTWTEEPGTRLSSRDGGILADPSLVSTNGGVDHVLQDRPCCRFRTTRGCTASNARLQPDRSCYPSRTARAYTTFYAQLQRQCHAPVRASETWQFLQIGGEFQAVATGGIADAELLLLPSGGYRLYTSEMSTHAIISFRSDDGLTWRREEGVRLSNGAFPDAVLLPDGRVRLCYQGAGVINSAISSDGGFTFTQEPGARVAPGWHGDLDASQVGAPTTVALPQVGFRMYYRGGQEDETFFNRISTVILSAVSTDGLTWRPEDGVRLDPADFVSPGAPDTTRFLDGPEALLTDDGAVTLYFWGVSVCDGVCLVTSNDGLAFQQLEQVFPTGSTPFRVNPGDPTVLPRPGGPWLMYFGSGPIDDQGIWIAQRQ